MIYLLVKLNGHSYKEWQDLQAYDSLDNLCSAIKSFWAEHGCDDPIAGYRYGGRHKVYEVMPNESGSMRFIPWEEMEEYLRVFAEKGAA